jgi:hypothetical protein
MKNEENFLDTAADVIHGNWELAKKPVDENATFRDLAVLQATLLVTAIMRPSD